MNCLTILLVYVVMLIIGCAVAQLLWWLITKIFSGHEGWGVVIVVGAILVFLTWLNCPS